MTTGLEDWTLEEVNGRNVLFYKGKNYIPQDTELRRDIVRMFHDPETAGHPGEIATYCYDFKQLRQSSTVVGSKVQVVRSLEECKS